jgi:hypothetical protein
MLFYQSEDIVAFFTDWQACWVLNSNRLTPESHDRLTRLYPANQFGDLLFRRSIGIASQSLQRIAYRMTITNQAILKRFFQLRNQRTGIGWHLFSTQLNKKRP